MEKVRLCRVDFATRNSSNDYYRFKKVRELVLNNDFYGAACVIDTRIPDSVPEYYSSTDFVLPGLEIDYRSNDNCGYDSIAHGILAITAIENWDLYGQSPYKITSGRIPDLFSYTKSFHNNKRIFDKRNLPENIVAKMKKEIKGAILRMGI